jgi:hypothetical protein
MTLLIELIVVVVAMVVLYLLFQLVKEIAPLILNSIAGLIVFFILNIVFGLGIPVNFWSILAVALGGFVGLLLVLILHFLGLAF